MRKKLLVAFIATIVTFCFVLTACGGEQRENHTHTFDQRNSASRYLKSEATCTHKAEYYFSCSCGEKGAEGFEYGDLAKHVFENYVSNDDATCSKFATETATCKNCTATDTRDISDSKKPHSFTFEAAKQEYLKTAATCTSMAVYYKSCKDCGARGEETFEYGEPDGHNFVNGVCFGCGRGYTEGLRFSIASGSYLGYKVTGIGTATETDVCIPDTYMNIPVVEIGLNAFNGNKLIKRVTIPDGVCLISGYAFRDCTSLESVTIPDTVTMISTGAFGGCSLLKSVTIPEGVTVINGSAFGGCSSLTSITIPDSVTKIGTNAFSGCTSLKSVAIGKNVAETGSAIFAYCTSLESITVDAENNSYHSRDNCLIATESKTLISGCKNSVIASDGSVTAIAGGAFYGYTMLESIIIPECVTAVNKGAFDGCSNLIIYCEAESQPDGWSEDWNFINRPVVWNCKNNDVADNGNIYLVADGIRYSLKDGVATVIKQSENISGAVVIPNTLTHKGKTYEVGSIAGEAFKGCVLVTDITIPDSVTSIDVNAFTDCVNLIQTENGVSYVDKWVIDCDSAVTEVVLRSDTKGIAAYAFNLCRSLNSVKLPDGITGIGNRAFEGCRSLTSINLPQGVISIGERAFMNCNSLMQIVMPDSVTDVGGAVFYGCEKLTSVTLSNNITSLPSFIITINNIKDVYGFFGSCASLEEIDIPDSVTSFGEEVFRGCASLTEIDIPDNITSIGEHAFAFCRALTGVTIGNGVTSIERRAFYECSALIKIDIPDNVTAIAYGAFQSCAALTEVTIGNGVTSIAEGAFWYSNALAAINVKENNTAYASLDGILYNKAKTEILFIPKLIEGTITIPQGITTIDELAFSNMSLVTEIIIPDSVTEIGDGAFYGCGALTGIRFNGTKAQWEAIEKGEFWNEETGNYTVHCTDGDLAKS